MPTEGERDETFYFKTDNGEFVEVEQPMPEYAFADDLLDDVDREKKRWKRLRKGSSFSMTFYFHSNNWLKRHGYPMRRKTWTTRKQR